MFFTSQKSLRRLFPRIRLSVGGL